MPALLREMLVLIVKMAPHLLTEVRALLLRHRGALEGIDDGVIGSVRAGKFDAIDREIDAEIERKFKGE